MVQGPVLHQWVEEDEEGKRLHMPCRRGALHSVLEAKER